MCLFVFLEIIFSRKFLTTCRTRVCFFTGVHELMSVQGSFLSVARATVLTLIRSFLSVYPAVLFQLTLILEFYFAYVALVLSQTTQFRRIFAIGTFGRNLIVL